MSVKEEDMIRIYSIWIHPSSITEKKGLAVLFVALSSEPDEIEASFVECLTSSSETWCRRWWHISQRSVSLSASSYSPKLNPLLMKQLKEPKATEKEVKRTARVSSAEKAETESIGSDVTVAYYRGLPRITVPLPSRRESCSFTMKPITHTVGHFLDMLKTEDRGIDRACITSLDGIRIASSNTIESLLEEDFKLLINDNEYVVSPPLQDRCTTEDLQKLGDVQALVAQLFEAFHVREYHIDMERSVIAELEDIRLQLVPMEQKLQEIQNAAYKKANFFVWTFLVMMSIQFGALARLTWWEYSWDIMEPVTYFVTYGTTMMWFIYYLVTRQEYMLPDVLNRRHLIVLHRRARKIGLDIDLYNLLKNRAYELETTLKIIRGPLYEYKTQREQKKRARSSSSSSRSPSSSPSPSPSPEKDVPKVIPESDIPRKYAEEYKI
ncbi:PREDICTED: calcium uniporter protein, mitochondrial [Vollenhovia emeryi]|uniref:calcium uniporter protein, mitochondrial n=1 Tax=Vollenhovia emeryi TaxID=411798 RepID=UPI0005F3844F|nr:PREDICTED: calcium uniporter protein, mitochondrial [Vollenhovia emeryi]